MTDLRPRGPRGRTKSCALCGTAFTCGLGKAEGEGCWCEDLPPLPAVDPAGDCRCPACLREATAPPVR